MSESWNPWKMTAIGMALVIVTALITGLVVAGWNSADRSASAPRAGSSGARQVAATPTAADVEACNRYAHSQVGDKTTEVVKDALIGGKNAGKGAGVGGLVGATAGTLYGLNEAKSHDGRYVEAYRACMRGRGFAG
jgi:hypothetical protein